MMNPQHVPPESGETACSACGAVIKAPPSKRRRRVQCPKCREVVFIEAAAGKPAETAPQPETSPQPAVATAPSVDERSRVDLLEARVEALEAALRDSMAARQAVSPGSAERKFVWITSEPARGPEFSPEQGQALIQNLKNVRTQAITIRTPAGDFSARVHAEWFKSVFERAGWTVHGPEEVAPGAAAAGLSLAVPEVPVAKQAAATYFALKAAGFEAIPVLDPSLDSARGEEPAAMALTVPPKKAA
jgi:hypothetical protein